MGTSQRKEILNIIDNSCEHLTAEQIYMQAKRKISKLALGTVYRNLNALAAEGSVRRIVISGRPDKFDKSTQPHEHIFCTVCGRTCDISLDGPIKHISGLKTDWNVLGYDLIIYGICPECRSLSGPQA